jgi:hypothetical protein
MQSTIYINTSFKSMITLQNVSRLPSSGHIWKAKTAQQQVKLLFCKQHTKQLVFHFRALLEFQIQTPLVDIKRDINQLKINCEVLNETSSFSLAQHTELNRFQISRLSVAWKKLMPKWSRRAKGNLHWMPLCGCSHQRRRNPQYHAG